MNLNVVTYVFYIRPFEYTEKDLDNHKIHLTRQEYIENMIIKQGDNALLGEHSLLAPL